jgi:hypothetical protein
MCMACPKSLVHQEQSIVRPKPGQYVDRLANEIVTDKIGKPLALDRKIARAWGYDLKRQCRHRHYWWDELADEYAQTVLDLPRHVRISEWEGRCWGYRLFGVDLQVVQGWWDAAHKAERWSRFLEASSLYNHMRTTLYANRYFPMSERTIGLHVGITGNRVHHHLTQAQKKLGVDGDGLFQLALRGLTVRANETARRLGDEMLVNYSIRNN